ncbi:MAG: hypothetical protein ACREX3_24865 [Gammaproteobacteria bacterium]
MKRAEPFGQRVKKRKEIEKILRQGKILNAKFIGKLAATSANRRNTYSYCDRCEAPIAYGNALVTVARNMEQIDRTADHSRAIVTVIQSDAVLTLCDPCGNRLGVKDLRQALRSWARKRQASFRVTRLPPDMRRRKGDGLFQADSPSAHLVDADADRSI